jgi:luciferase family oxidoreductase group 1
MVTLSVLDQAPISEGSTGGDALRNSVDLARHAEALGYARYWVAEHHGTPALACASPEALIGPIAAATSRIRVGSGGVMLPHYSPLKVAETFSMFAGLFGDRIDLAVGRAAGTDPVTAFALQRDRRQAAPDDFPAQLVELMAYLEDDMPKDHPFARLTALPGRPAAPELWLLGSSAQSGIWAAELGLPYAFADFINPQGAEIAAHYREHFEPSKTLAAPRTTVAVWALCADTEEEARRLAASAKMMFTLFFRGTLIPIPPVEKALEFLAAETADASPPAMRRRTIVGTPEQVREGIERVARDYAAEEVMVVTITFDHAVRRRSYELIAEAFALT